MESKNIRNVLNHGFVRLVSYMQPVPLEENWPEGGHGGGRVDLKVQPHDWTGDLEIVRNARVSYDADWRTGSNEGADEKLIHYMYANNHTSPFESMVFTFEVMVPIFITRQWHRHRTWSYNEVSARYAELPDVFYLPEPETVGVQSKHNKQMRDIEEERVDALEILGRENQIAILNDAFKQDYGVYQDLIELGWPRELARTKLPVSIYTRFFATVDLHNLFHFLRLRLHEHAQYEIRVYAQAMLDLIDPIVPVAVDAFIKKRAEDEMIDRMRKVCKDNKLHFTTELGQMIEALELNVS